MHDVRFIRENPQAFDKAMRRRGVDPVAEQIIELDAKRRNCIERTESAQARRNAASKEAGQAKSRGDEGRFEELRARILAERDTLAELKQELDQIVRSLNEALASYPNIPADDVPVGDSEDENAELRRWGQRPEFGFEPLEHFDIPGARAGLDFDASARLSGSRFVVMSGAIARLHRALSQFMIDIQVDRNGCLETWTPVIVNGHIMFGTGQLPKFGADSYRLEDGKWLVPTAEVTLTNLVAGMIVEEDSLPRRYCAHTQCFRSEAGAAGKDTAGMLRQHQFEKVEMVSITTPETSEAEQQRMTRCAEGILEALGLHYRTVSLCDGDLGFGARRTFDIEVWLPGQGKFREISSVSTCGDFQARRMNARYRPAGGGSPRFVHTLNGSGLAVGRTLIAVLENGQQRDGSIRLPTALSPYLGGRLAISPTGDLLPAGNEHPNEPG